MSKEQPLTKQQKNILTLIYRFRFVSSKHVQQALGIKYISNVQPRLNSLMEKGLVGRNYTGSQRLAGLPASYYLLPAGMKALKGFDPDVNKSILHAAYKDKAAGNGFVQRSIAVGDINVQLEQVFGDILEFFTQSECKEYDYFPQPLPDAYLTINDHAYFLEVCADSAPTFLIKQRIEQYVEYVEQGDWEEQAGSKLPEVLFACASESLCRRLKRVAHDVLENSFDDDLKLLITTTQEILSVLDPKKKARELHAPEPSS